MTTVYEHVVRVINPQYVGYEDQIKAVLYALGIDPSTEWPIHSECDGVHFIPQRDNPENEW